MEHKKTIQSYITGFVVSIILTFSAYVVVLIHISSEHEVISHEVLIVSILVLAVIQLIVQLFFFLHLGTEKGPKWNLAIFVSTISVILIIVVGSLWIMAHLNYNMSPSTMTNILIDDEGIPAHK